MTLHISSLSLYRNFSKIDIQIQKSKKKSTLLATKAQRIGNQAPARWELKLSTLATKAQQTALRVEEKTVVRAKETYLYIYENPLAPSLPERQKENKGTYMSV